MTDHVDHRRPSNGDIYGRLDRIEDLLTARLDRIDSKVDAVDVKVDGATSRLDKMEGALTFVKWLGPAGIAALVYGLLTAQGFI